ncbi:cytochrome c biogenesis protein [Bacteriovorax sp. DB6_IX]|uniref:cytochrome c biogenesis protein n=1 Tax=Bacteriovorax sp. DB6_IX TaxID=1353530 RepID=UPI000389E793|nr:cytochrome c biogenesis protein CcsA [Bacteriovorax sp. DB6_IX]EQC52048.1 putative cytochrome c-type biogenesis protein CcsB [Bacteriovorax sp. DB6_IX]
MSKFMQFIAVFTFMFSVQATETYFCTNELGKMPVRQGGRIKPLSVHAKESIKHLTGKSKVGDLSAVEAYCLLSAKAFGMPSKMEFKGKLEHRDTRKLFDGKKEMSYEELMQEQRTIRSAWMRIKEDNGAKKDLNRLLAKVNLYQDITAGNNWTLPLINGSETTWVPLASFLTEEKVMAMKASSSKPFETLFKNVRDEYIKTNGDDFMLEYQYDKMQLMRVAMLTTLLALAALVLFKKFTIALSFSAITLIIQTIYLVMRVYISGRAPVTNMYETVMFSGYGGLFLAMAIGHFKKEKAFIYMGLGYNVCCLMMLNFAGSMVSESISPLVPVLRDNFWLSTHVTTIILSYGALALSWIMANTIIIKKFFSKLSKNDEAYYNDLIYTSLKYGIVLLAAGIILGGVWADYSWGRFWGWDPKETWSLIVLCIYMAILHGKYTNWIPGHRFAHLIAAAFMSVMMAWFGVNYILASGLHSYGFSEGGAIFLGTFFTIQTVILLITLKSSKTSVA